jgi:hypothetical protein
VRPALEVKGLQRNIRSVGKTLAKAVMSGNVDVGCPIGERPKRTNPPESVTGYLLRRAFSS